MENQVTCFQKHEDHIHHGVWTNLFIYAHSRFVPVLLRFALLSMSECSNSLQDLPLLGVLVAHYVCYTQPTIRLLAQRHDVLLHSNASRIVQPLGIPCVYYMTDLSWIFACMYNYIYILFPVQRILTSLLSNLHIIIIWYDCEHRNNL